MKILTIIGDPTSVNNSLANVLKDNPKMKIVTMTTGPYIIQQPGPIHTMKPNQAIPVHVLYIIYEGVETLVSQDGKPLEIVN